MQPHELEVLIESHTEELTEEDLEELISEEDSEDEKEVIARSTVYSKALAEIMKLQRALIDKVLKCDPVMKWSLNVKRKIENHPALTLKSNRNCRTQRNKGQSPDFFSPNPLSRPALTCLCRPHFRICVDFTSSFFYFDIIIIIIIYSN
jgi:hypothetical protein